MAANIFPDTNIQRYREDLAASLRWVARLGWAEAVANHFSFAVDDAGSQFLMNPRWRHFANVRASELLLLDANDPAAMQGERPPDPTAWSIHGAIHRMVPHARCVMHLHTPGSLALACLEDKKLPPIDNNTARFFNRVSVDEGFNGMSLADEEGERIAACIGDKEVLLMGNHGVLVASRTVAQAFDKLYYFERACQTYIDVLGTGRPISVMHEDIALKTAQQWDELSGFADAHLREIREILDRDEPDYRD